MTFRSNEKASTIKITTQRCSRIYKLLLLMAKNRSKRSAILKKLKIGSRTFYRDLDLLRECGLNIDLNDHGYRLKNSIDDSLQCLPFPDPHFTFHDAVVLSKGRSKSHQKLKQQIEQMTK